MAKACCLSPTASAPPNSPAGIGYPARRHRHPAAVLCLPISAPLEQIDRRILTRTFRGPVETEARKPRELQYRRREARCNAEVANGQGLRVTETGPGGEGAVPDFDISRLEAYTERFRSEVLCVNALLEEDDDDVEEEEEEQVIVFKGFSSSLTRATPDDPSEPALPATAVIQSIDRMRAPYNPSKPQHIEQGISWPQFHRLLEEKGL